MIPLQRFILKKENRKDHEDEKRNGFLDNLELNEGERSTMFFVPNSIGRDLQDVLEQGNPPTNEDDAHEPQVLTPFHILELEVAVPRKSHEGIGQKKEYDGLNCFHCALNNFLAGACLPTFMHPDPLRRVFANHFFDETGVHARVVDHVFFFVS